MTTGVKQMIRAMPPSQVAEQQHERDDADHAEHARSTASIRRCAEKKARRPERRIGAFEHERHRLRRVPTSGGSRLWSGVEQRHRQAARRRRARRRRRADRASARRRAASSRGGCPASSGARRAPGRGRSATAARHRTARGRRGEERVDLDGEHADVPCAEDHATRLATNTNAARGSAAAIAASGLQVDAREHGAERPSAPA